MVIVATCVVPSMVATLEVSISVSPRSGACIAALEVSSV
jgi:hypothetical protein